MPFSYVGRDRKSGWGGVLGPWGPHRACLSPRHLPRAVSGVLTAPRVPALGATGLAPQRTTVASISERSSGQGTARRLPAAPPTASSAPGRASACGRGSLRGQVGAEAWSPREETPESEWEASGVGGAGLLGLWGQGRGPGLLGLRGRGWGLDSWVRGGGARGLDPVLITAPPPGETRRILSVQPTYDWTCFSHSLLNVSPMPVESSPPLPCPTPCHLLPNCSFCLDSKGADGGWQHCVWSSSLQQVLHLSGHPVSFL